MPDKMPSLPNGVRTTTNENAAQRTLELKNQADVKAAEKRIRSSTENLNEILSLITIVDVYYLSNIYLTFREQTSICPPKQHHPWRRFSCDSENMEN